MGGLILSVNTLYRLFCFFKLFAVVGKGLITITGTAVVGKGLITITGASFVLLMIQVTPASQPKYGFLKTTTESDLLFTATPVSPHLQRELLQMENGRSEDGRREAERREEEGRRREQDAQRETRGQCKSAVPTHPHVVQLPDFSRKTESLAKCPF